MLLKKMLMTLLHHLLFPGATSVMGLLFFERTVEAIASPKFLLEEEES
jgi:hypothetical protein